jgi:hypothetical protein
MMVMKLEVVQIHLDEPQIREVSGDESNHPIVSQLDDAIGS